MLRISNLLPQIGQGLLSLPVILLALTIHELAHGYAAYLLGDPTARNLGRLTLNPLKHLDPIGFICLFLFHFGWAKPVPINSRNFKNPKWDIALTGLAGPLSNLLQALLYTCILRFLLSMITRAYQEDMALYITGSYYGTSYTVSAGFTVLSILCTMVYLGVIVNFGYAVFNMIPIPPLDGSRVLYVFLPTRLYFKVMKYERIIAGVLFVLLWFGLLSVPLQAAIYGLQDGVFWLFGIRKTSEIYQTFSIVVSYVFSFFQ